MGNSGFFGDNSTTGINQLSQNAGAYKTPNQNGADYSLWGQIGNLFTGQNTEAENYTTAQNQQTAEERERQFNAAQAELARNFSASEAAKEREFNSAEAEKAREWTAHSYERMVKDAKAAGINPLYLVGAGAGNTGTTAASARAATGTAARSSSNAPTMNGEKGGLNLVSFLGKIALTAAAFAIKKS